MRLPWQRNKREILTDEDILSLLQAQVALNNAQLEINLQLSSRLDTLEQMIFNEAVFKHVDQRTRH